MGKKSRILYILLVICTLIALNSCKSTQKSAVSDTVYITKIEYEVQSKIDSIYIDRFRDRYIKGDTVYVVEDKVEYRFKFRTDTVNMIDTVYISKVDLQEKVVEKNKYPLLPWEILGAVALILAIIIMVKRRNATR